MTSFRDLFARATGNAPFPYQTRLAQSPAFPDLLAVPTGCGKTAAAILPWLWRRRSGPAELRAVTPRRLVVCLPMRVLVEQTAAVARGWIDRLGLTGEVGVHVLMGGAVDDTWDQHPERDAVLVGTQDQLLSRALLRGYAMSRFRWPVHFAWLNHDCLWVMDETQLMGSGLSTSAQLQGLREALGGRGTHTMWMSATLDEKRLGTVDFRARPLVRMTLEKDDEEALAVRLGARKPVDRAATAFDDKDLRALADEVRATHRPGTRTLVVLNRVKRAQALTLALRKSAGGVDVRLIHSRFRRNDRKEAERVALAREFDGILVATQAVEAGVDVSAATLFTELAPWSSLVQRFGRCNRYGEFGAEHVAVRWVDLPDDDEVALPYEVPQLQFARDRLVALADAGPAALAGLQEPPAGPNLPVIRRRDVFDLFDTTADLSGHDLDISPYVRDADDGSDAQIAWRSFSEEGPPDGSPALHRDELCRVRASDLSKLALWRWDSLEGQWRRAKSAVPGLAYLVRDTEGRYDPALGWTGANTPAVPPVPELTPLAPDADEEDPDATLSHYVTLRTHSDDAAEAMATLVETLGASIPTAPPGLLVRAARWHDLGKAHAAFQQMLTAKLPPGHPDAGCGPFAKSDRRFSGRSPRQHFRHELASALAALEHGEPDLLCYLVAAHHGKVRTAIRSRPTERPTHSERLALGVIEGDPLPATDLGAGLTVPATTLRLDVMDVGETEGRATWATRVAKLLAEHGPFRLAYLESLVRAADWTASRKRDGKGGSHA